MKSNSAFSAASSVAAVEAAYPSTPDGIVIEFHENAVPDCIEHSLEQLYGNVYSTLAHFQAYGGLPANTCTYVVRSGNRITSIFLFRCERGEAKVLNEGMRLDEEEVARFSRHLFAKYRTVDVIRFNAVQSLVRRLDTPYQSFRCTDDIVLTVPASPQAYFASLGRNLRRNIRRYHDRLSRGFPSFRYDFHDGMALDEAQIRAVIGFNKARIAGKDLAYALDEAEVERIVRLVKASGFAGVATIDSGVAGGVIGYRAGDNYFFKVIGHDPQYNDYSLGILCCYLTICECIKRGCAECNLMQDGYAYKFALGGVARPLQSLTIYRSRTHLLRHGGMALKTALSGYLHEIKARLLDNPGAQDGFVARQAIRLVGGIRGLKRAANDLLHFKPRID
jgi:hypothetical protein